MKIIIGTCCAAALWFASPYFALYNFVMALKEGDQLALQKQVSWPDVREGFKEDFGEMLAEKVATEPKLKNNTFSLLGSVLGSAIVDRHIDFFVARHVIVSL